MHYFSALIVPVVADAARTRRLTACAIDDLLCESGADGHVVGFRPRDGAGHGKGFEALVDDHLAVVVEICGRLAGFPARVAWSNAAVVLDYAIVAARACSDADDGILGEAEALIARDGHPLLAQPYATDRPHERRVCCLRYLLPDGVICPGLCPRARGRVHAALP